MLLLKSLMVIVFIISVFWLPAKLVQAERKIDRLEFARFLRQRIGKAESTHEVDVTDPTMTYDGTDTTITVPLTQEQAGGFVAGAYVLAQVNWMEGTARDASTIGRVAWGENLLDEVMADE